MTALQALRTHGIVPIATIDDVGHAAPLADALTAAGLPLVEVTLRTPSAAAAIEALSRQSPTLVVGAGTVLTVDQARMAAAAGCHFVVSPGLDAAVVGWCRDNDMPVIPGAITPSEIGTAVRLELTLIKFFPAEPMGGADAIRALGAVFPDLEFIPTGGIDDGNLGRYSRLGNVAACGASWIAERSLLRRGAFETIRERAVAAMSIVTAARQAAG